MSIWQSCLEQLEGELSPQQFNTWIRPLQAVEDTETIRLLAPNRFVLEWINHQYLGRIQELVGSLLNGRDCVLRLEVGSQPAAVSGPAPAPPAAESASPRPARRYSNHLSAAFRFDTFVEGKSNQLARAAAVQVAENPGNAYNPLFICGGVGLGKTHLMQAIGHAILEQKPTANIAYLHSERFVADMVRALQHNAINDFKRYYRSLDALLIDDIQFFAGKERSQEEFFHTFNALLEGQQQIVLTCDRYPRELDVEERLTSRFGWGLTVPIEPPELETRVAILQKKAEAEGFDVPDDVLAFIAARVQNNIRELEGRLARAVAFASLSSQPVTMQLAQEVLRPLLDRRRRRVREILPLKGCDPAGARLSGGFDGFFGRLIA